MTKPKMKPMLKLFTSNPLGHRVSLSLDSDSTYPLSLTNQGVRLFKNFYGMDAGENGKPKVFRGYCDDFRDLPIVSQQNYNGLDILCESDGETVIISTGSKTTGKNWLIKVTRYGIYRYFMIDKALLDQLDWPYDNDGRLQVLR